MGIDGQILIVDGLWLNTTYLSKEWIEYLERLREKYVDLLLMDAYAGVEGSDILFAMHEPTILYPNPLGTDRRPLIITNSEQLKILKPTIISGQETMDEDNTELWEPSYGNYLFRLMIFPEEYRTATMTKITSREYELNDQYPQKAALTAEEITNLTILLSSSAYSFLGRFLVYYTS